MRGSAAFRAAIAPGGLLAGPWVQNELWRRAKAKPSLDLRFAERKSLVDATTGQNLVTFTRASSATYVDSTGTIRSAVTNLLVRSEEFDDASWAKISSAVTSNAGSAPTGAVTADKLIVDNGQSAGYASQSASFVSSTSYTASCYAKAGEVSDFRLVFESGAFGSNLNAVFNLNTGVVTSFTAASASMQNVGNGWYRCVATATATASASAGVQFRSVHAGNGTNGILLWGAQLEQSSTVGEYIPTTSTINSAPRFDHNPTTGESLGLLVEEARTNLCLQSEAFGTSPWAASNVTVTANTATSPAATLTADTLAATSANGTVTQPVTTTAVAMTFSVYLKRKTGTGNIDITADGSTWVTQTINSSTWTRCIVTQTAVAGTSNPGIRIVTSGDEIYAWGGQYE